MTAMHTTAASLGLLVCHACGQHSKPAPGVHESKCPRCGALLHLRKSESISRTWALLIAAAILYIPAYVLPILETSSLFDSQTDTILSGIVFLWTTGSWLLAVVVFIASVMVPLLKLIAVTLLVISVQRRSRWRPDQRARLYRLAELIGRWSMLDIFVVAILVTLVQLHTLANIRAGSGAIAFGAVVVLTLFATLSFDPRLIWDPLEQKHG